MRQHFLIDPELTFLNHGSFGACPIEVLNHQRALQDEMEKNPCEFLGRRSALLLSAARAALADFLGTRASNLIFVENATTGVNIAAHSIALSPGDEVLACDLEYGACDAAWDIFCQRQGATYRRIPVRLPFDAHAFAADMKNAMTTKTRVLFLSHVTSSTALILPIEELIGVARERGIIVVIDGAHAPAFLELDLDALGAHFYTGNCHKWMCAPKGAGFLYVAPDLQDTLAAPVISWGYVAQGDDSPRRLYTGTGALEERLQWLGTRDPSAFLSVPRAIDFLAAHDWRKKREDCRALALETALILCGRFGIAPIAQASALGPMVAIPLPPCDAERVRAALFERHRIEIPVGLHNHRPFARISLHLYSTRADAMRLVTALPDEVARAS